MGKFDLVKIDFEKHPIFRRMMDEGGFTLITDTDFDAMLAEGGLKMVVIADDPNRMKESLDIAVIAPELKKSIEQLLSGCYLVHPMKARALAGRYGVRKMPSIAFFRGSMYLGAAEGLLNWSEYMQQIGEITVRTESPKRTIAIASANSEPSSCGH